MDGLENARSAEVASKLATGKGKKTDADAAFKAGDMKAALLSYHQALLWLNGLDKSALPGYKAPDPSAQEKEKSEIDELLEKIHSNMAACHIKNSNWKRALESAEKAIAKNDKNYKAIFRKGKAQGELGFFEKAETTLTQLLKDNPADAVTIQAELDRLRKKDQEREKVHSQKYRGFLSRDKGTGKSVDKGKGVDPGERTAPLGAGRQSGFIEEVDEPEPAPNAAESDAEDAKEIPVVKA
ncbi:hypothetical protein EXIGLDRAFT_781111 [Exidia glandulosa HHB12029]|uniref:Uncharacterized protein n=1 Tax=Exidia glandulosa HHB12029 TaxID=1314781 RepID=A0A165BCW0_EXIGL|nr:hypothetical protein EXIGLDRAFT_781111 [Exidia glandulosa HHB12029]